VAAHITKFSEASAGSAADEPLHTVTAGGEQARPGTGNAMGLVTASPGEAARHELERQPSTTRCTRSAPSGTHHAEVRALLMKYYGTGQDQSLARARCTPYPTKDRFGLVTVKGEVYAIADIGMRMLEPRELYRAQGFPDSYVIERGPTAAAVEARPGAHVRQQRVPARGARDRRGELRRAAGEGGGLMGYLNPLLKLPAGRALLALPREQREPLEAVLRELRAQADVEAENAWRRRKGPMAAYWRAVATYARHTAHALSKGAETNPQKGDQPRFERGREGMEPAVCESAAGRGAHGAPALATLPQYASPVGGPMGSGQPAAAGPFGEREAA
jgi:hypothetical protein